MALSLHLPLQVFAVILTRSLSKGKNLEELNPQLLESFTPNNTVQLN
jgi:hypothetical protein